jgi:uncharacterized protein (TIGR03437 family)
MIMTRLIEKPRPEELADGQAEVLIGKPGQTEVSRGLIALTRVSPGVFSANADGRGAPAAVLLRIGPDGSQRYESVVEFDSAQQRFVSRAIEFGPEGEQAILLLFGTGIRNRSALNNAQMYIGEAKAELLYAGLQSDFAGLDQMNIRLPRNLTGRGEVSVFLTVDGKFANPIQLRFK